MTINKSSDLEDDLSLTPRFYWRVLEMVVYKYRSIVRRGTHIRSEWLNKGYLSYAVFITLWWRFETNIFFWNQKQNPWVGENERVDETSFCRRYNIQWDTSPGTTFLDSLRELFLRHSFILEDQVVGYSLLGQMLTYSLEPSSKKESISFGMR